MIARQRKLRRILVLSAGIFTAVIAVIAYSADVLRDAELDTVDARFSIRGDEAPPKDIVVVQIDDVTFGDLNRWWPFPRRIHASVLSRLASDGARAVAYDVQFTEPTTVTDDNALIRAVDRARGVVLATDEVNRRGESRVLGGEELLRQIGARAGHSTIPDTGGVLRHVPFEVDGLETIAVATTEEATGRQVNPASFAGEHAWIDYHGPPGSFQTVSFSRVARGKTPPGFFKGKVVVVGAAAPTLHDIHPTSVSGDDLMSGAEIQANAISTVRRGLPLDDVSAGIDVAAIVVLALVVPVASLFLSAIPSILLTVGAGVGWAVLAQWLFNRGLIVAFLYPLGALGFSAVAALAIRALFTTLERQRVREIFARFVPEDAVQDVLACTDSDLRLGGVRRESTVLFSDIRGFTTFSESRPPALVVKVLNRYLAEMTEAIMDNGGTLVSYMGDGIMAVFGAPLEQEDHADRAVSAAREMLSERLTRFNEWLQGEGIAEGFRMGIGLNSGSVMSGNIGSERRLEYTTIGDATNTAARLEGMTKGTPHQVLIAESTRVLLRREVPDLVYVGEEPVRGRSGTVKLWSLGAAEAGPDPEAERAGSSAS